MDLMSDLYSDADSVSIPCPRCGAANPARRSTCISCGAELGISTFAEMFGPPNKLKGRYVVQRPLRQGATFSLYLAKDAKNGTRACLVHQVALTSLELDQREMLEVRFLQEAEIWRERRHPSILAVLDAESMA